MLILSRQRIQPWALAPITARMRRSQLTGSLTPSRIPLLWVVPQQGTGAHLDTLGDKIMTPMVYQFRNGTESLWADQTILLNYPNGPTAVRWYRFDVTGGNFPATPVQQQDWTNGNDGLWRFMPSVAVDNSGNTAIGYSVSSSAVHPGIRYAGRLEG